jgi:hypothetical protein
MQMTTSLSRQTFALVDRCARQRAEGLHRYGLLGEPEDGVVRHLAVGDEIHGGGREKDLHKEGVCDVWRGEANRVAGAVQEEGGHGRNASATR